MYTLGMEIEFVLACDNAIVDSEGKVSIIGIFSEIKSTSFPALHPQLFVVVGIRGAAGEYPVSISIGKSDELVTKGEGHMKIAKNGKAATFIAKFVGNTFEEEGEYEILAKVADNKPKPLPLQLRKV